MSRGFWSQASDIASRATYTQIGLAIGVRLDYQATCPFPLLRDRRGVRQRRRRAGPLRQAAARRWAHRAAAYAPGADRAPGRTDPAPTPAPLPLSRRAGTQRPDGRSSPLGYARPARSCRRPIPRSTPSTRRRAISGRCSWHASTAVRRMPIWTAILASLILGERMNRMRTLAVALGFVGILVILRPGVASVSPGALSSSLLQPGSTRRAPSRNACALRCTRQRGTLLLRWPTTTRFFSITSVASTTCTPMRLECVRRMGGGAHWRRNPSPACDGFRPLR